jgi:hypothetical protein
MLKLKTILLPLADWLVPPRRAKAEAPLVVVENPAAALLVVPPKALTSFPVVAVIQVLEPFDPLR